MSKLFSLLALLAMVASTEAFSAVGYSRCLSATPQRMTAEAIEMGRGDKRTKKGKIFKGSFGKTRPKQPPAKIRLAKPASFEALKED